VIQFFDKMKERLYPVGRLDYLSEGLLVVTNDGDLANRLTKASSGVEKTYLVKVAGQPTEDELNILRGGVAIERGKPGSPEVRTSPARIRQVRQGDNPWYEVVLIEGRNRELRKMFEEVGHFVEKIRRVGYGPLVLDQEPGSLRELELEELDALRKAAEGKLRTPKAKELRRRNLLDAGLLPTVLPKPSSRPRALKPLSERPATQPVWKKDDRPARPPSRLTAGSTGAGRPFSAKPAWKKPERQERLPYKPPAPPRRAVRKNEARPPRKPEKLYIEPVQREERFTRPSGPRPGSVRPGTAKPFRGEGGLARPFTTSSGKPRAGGARPSSKPGRPSGGPGSRPSSPFRPYTPRTEGASGYRPTQAKPYSNFASRAERKAGSGWKPKPSFGGSGKPSGSSRSKPKPGGFSKSSYKTKPGGAKRTSPRPSGASGGRKRG
jgi:23S rRNA pseudouridine2605 synthase